jgi:hypothetical protein
MQSACEIFCHLRHVWLYYIFPHYVINGTILEKKKLLSLKVCFDFLYKFCLKFVPF